MYCCPGSDQAPSPSACPSPSLEDVEFTLEKLCCRAQQEVEAQPIPTQNHLTCQTRHLFAKYKLDGTGNSLRSAIARYFTDSAHSHNDRPSFSPPLPVDYEPPPPDRSDSRMVDDDSRNLVRDMPFLVDRKFHIRPDVKLPVHLFEGIERIFRIYQFQAEAMLKHHCDKYGDEAIFRVGIRSLFLSRSDTLFESTRSHALGLNADTRLFLLQVYERHPDINMAEKRLLARSARVPEHVIESFWASLTTLRTPYLAMRTVIAARELHKRRQYKEEQRRQEQERQQRRQEQEWQRQRQRRHEQEIELLRNLESECQQYQHQHHQRWRRSGDGQDRQFSGQPGCSLQTFQTGERKTGPKTGEMGIDTGQGNGKAGEEESRIVEESAEMVLQRSRDELRRRLSLLSSAAAASNE